MIFQNLKISNFGSIGELELPLENQGLTLILGRNEDAPRADSNGAGKSLPLDAFTWALWGNTVRGFSTDDVVHNKVGKNCVVQVNFEEGDNFYSVTRFRRNTKDKDRKPNDLILICNGDDVSGASISATQDMIEEILGLDFVTFCAMMPGAGITVATMTDSEVKGLLEKLLRTEALGKASEEARKRHRAASEQNMVLTTQQRDLETSIVEVKERIDNLTTKLEEYDSTREEQIASLQGRIDKFDEDVTNHRKAMEGEQDLLIRKGEALTLKEGAQSKVDACKADLVKTTIHYRDKIQQLDKELAIIDSHVTGLERAKKDMELLDEDCPTCGQDISDEHKTSAIEHYDKQLRLLYIKQKTIEESVSVTKTKQKEEETDLLQTQDENIKRLDAADKALKEVNSELEDIAERQRIIDAIEDMASELRVTMVELKSEDNPYGELLESEKGKLDEKETLKSDLVTELLQNQHTLEQLKFWVDSFSPQGLRSFMLEHVTPLLNTFAKKYADLVTDGEMSITFHTKDTLKSGKSKEKFNIQVAQKHGGGSYQSNSSGEKARANLIIALALGELAALRAEKTIPFRFLDEPFESIDEAGTEAIVTLLNLQKEKYNTVYVITHQDHFKQLFPRKLTVVKQGGFSSLEG